MSTGLDGAMIRRTVRAAQEGAGEPIADDPLTEAERGRSVELKAELHDDLDRQARFGRNLAVVQDEGLYRATHRTFAAFCWDEFGLSPRHAADRMLWAKRYARRVRGNRVPPLLETADPARPDAGSEPEELRDRAGYWYVPTAALREVKEAGLTFGVLLAGERETAAVAAALCASRRTVHRHVARLTGGSDPLLLTAAGAYRATDRGRALAEPDLSDGREADDEIVPVPKWLPAAMQARTGPTTPAADLILYGWVLGRECACCGVSYDPAEAAAETGLTVKTVRTAASRLVAAGWLR